MWLVTPTNDFYFSHKRIVSVLFPHSDALLNLIEVLIGTRAKSVVGVLTVVRYWFWRSGLFCLSKHFRHPVSSWCHVGLSVNDGGDLSCCAGVLEFGRAYDGGHGGGGKLGKHAYCG